MKAYRISVILFISLAVLGCDFREYYTLKRSARRTKSQIRTINRDLTGIGKLFGVQNTADSASNEEILEELEPLEQKNMLNTYGYLYDFLNPSEKDLLSSNNFYWDSTNQVYYVQSERVRQLNSNYEVFGWHPYWMGDAWKSYPFKLLSTLSYFAYKVDPATGSYQNPKQIEEWKTTAMIDSAKANQTRVLLSVASHGMLQNEQFLNNPEAWNVLADSIANLVNLRQAEGVDLNFEGIPYRDRWAFVSFVEQLRQTLSLKLNQSTPFISLTLPAQSNRNSFEIRALQSQVDLFVIMGYNYQGNGRSNGAVAPLRTVETNGNSLQKTVEYYIDEGIDGDKTILALPYFGSRWTGELGDNGLYETFFDKEVTFREIMTLYNSNYQPEIDITSMTKYHFIEFQDSSSLELWFDDDFTLGKKYDFALSNQLKGIGIWALGYDNGYTELWDVINEKFTTDTLVIADPIAEADGYPIKLSGFLLQYKNVLLTVFLMFALSVVMGFFIAFNDWRVRESLFGSQLYRYLIMLIFAILLIPLLSLMEWFSDDRWKLLLAFLSGILCFYIVTKISVSFSSNKP